MKRLIIGLAFSFLAIGSLFSQAIRVGIHDGSTVEQKGVGQIRAGKLQVKVEQVSPSEIAFELWNFSLIPIFQGSGAHVDTPVFIRDVAVGIPPGWIIEVPELRGAQNLGFQHEGLDIWSIVNAEERKSVDVKYPLSLSFHMLIGGERARWSAVDPNVPAILPDRNSPLAQTMKEMLGCQNGPVNETLWPRLARLKKSFKGDAGSLTYSQNQGTRDLGWYMRWFHKRFAYDQWGATTTAWDFGMIPWSEGNTNGHYDAIRHCVENYLTYGDPGALLIAKITATWKATHGFHDEEEHVSGTWAGFWNHRWAYEKTTSGTPDDQGRKGYGHVGSYYIPSYGHEWDMGTLMVAKLTGDPYLLSVMTKRGEKLLATTPQNFWQGYWGVRLAAWPLQNLWAFWKLTGDVRFKNHAQACMDYWFNAPWWPATQDYPTDIPSPGQQSGWMTGMWLTACYWWLDEGVGTAYAARIEKQAKWVVQYGTSTVNTVMGPALQIGYVIDIADPSKTSWSPPLATSFLLPAIQKLSITDPATYGSTFTKAKLAVGYGPFVGWGGFVQNITLTESDWGSSQFPGSMTKAGSQHNQSARAIWFQ